MDNDKGWTLLDWAYVCDQAPGIEAAHRKASDSAEYGVNFHEFINTEEGLSKYAQEWWSTLSKERKLELLRDKADVLRNQLEDVEAEINNRMVA